MTRQHVVFRSALSSDSAECIAHVSNDGVKTLCGRLTKDAETVEVDAEAQPDCRTCARVLSAQIRAAVRLPPILNRNHKPFWEK